MILYGYVVSRERIAMYRSDDPYPNRFLRELDWVVEPRSKKWSVAAGLYIGYVVIVGLESGFASAAVVAYLVPFILAVLLVAGALISTIISEPLN